MNKSKEMEFTFHFRSGRRGKQKLMLGKEPEITNLKPGCVPHISRLMALAISMDGLIQTGKVKDYAELATLGRVSPPRITQIMSLLNLAPDIQEEILFLPNSTEKHYPLKLKQIQHLAREPNWQMQKDQWNNFRNQFADILK